MVESVDPVEVSQEIGQLLLTDQLRPGSDQVRTRDPEDVDHPGRDITADLLVAARAGEQIPGLPLVQLQTEIADGDHQVAAGGTGCPNHGVTHVLMLGTSAGEMK